MNSLENLVLLLSRLPGIGKKSALRLAYSLLKGDEDYNRLLGESISTIKEKIHRCRLCGNYTEGEFCSICSSSDREEQILCVVEEPRDVAMIESTGDFQGRYFVLHGVLAPLEGVGPGELGFDRLLKIIDDQNVQELILATNPTMEGDSTALYIKHLLKDRNLKITRIASGLPVGGDMEYADTLSISRALKGRLLY